jgi:hypothetical protein
VANIDRELFVRKDGKTVGHNGRKSLDITGLTLHPHTMTSFIFDVAFNDDVDALIPPRIEVTVYYPNTKPVHKVLLISPKR